MAGEATYVVELTPVGRGAVAVVLVAGPGAVAAVDRHFYRPRGQRLASAPPERILVGRWGAPTGEELVVCRRGDDMLEVHCHGGTAAVCGVVERLTASGCERLTWTEWVRRAAVDPLRAAAEIALAAAPTERTAALLLDQWNGALSTALHETLAAAERGDVEDSAARLVELLRYRAVGLHLTTPWRVVLAGPPNVGKSSLLNALLGFQRALVSDQPGTTRDVVTAASAFDGWPVELSDTAGLRTTDDEIESAGVALATSAANRADLVLLVSDGERLAELPSAAARVLRVRNKIDLPTDDDRGDYDVRTSTITGAGIAELVARIGAMLVEDVPPTGAPLPFTPEHVAALEAALDAARRGEAAAIVVPLRALLAAAA